MRRVATLTNRKPVEVKQILNGFCAIGQHDQCPGSSKATRSDSVTFVCICPCHKGEIEADVEAQDAT